MNLANSLPSWVKVLSHPITALLGIIGGFAWLAYLTRKGSNEAVVIYGPDRTPVVGQEHPVVAIALMALCVALLLALGTWWHFRNYKVPLSAQLPPAVIPSTPQPPGAEAPAKKPQFGWLNDLVLQPIQQKTTATVQVFSIMALYDQKPTPIRLRLKADSGLKDKVERIDLTMFDNPVSTPQWRIDGDAILIDFAGPAISMLSPLNVAITMRSPFQIFSVERWGSPGSPSAQLGN